MQHNFMTAPIMEIMDMRTFQVNYCNEMGICGFWKASNFHRFFGSLSGTFKGINESEIISITSRALSKMFCVRLNPPEHFLFSLADQQTS